MSDPTNLGDIAPDGASDLPAVITWDGDEGESHYTYAEFDALVDSIAAGLAARGLARGDRVAVLGDNSATYLAAEFAIMRAGLVVVPVNQRFPASLVEFVVADSESRLVLVQERFRSLCPAGVPSISVDIDSTEFREFVRPGPFETVTPEPDEPAMYLYTSGSTGKPKGVELSHASHLWVLRVSARSHADARLRHLVAAPLCHMNALSVCQRALSVGDSVVILPRFSTGSYIRAADRFQCTELTGVTPMFAMMLRDEESLAQASLSSVRGVRLASAPLSIGLMERVSAQLPNAGPTNGYGTTEAGPIVFAPHPGGLPTPNVSVGTAHPLVDLRLVDDNGDDADEGVLWIRCPALMNGYHNRPELPSPVTADGYYVTGDIFHRDADGFFYFVGRADDMFVSGGENIYPGEVERIIDAHPAVQSSCVVPIEDDIKAFKPVAFVVADTGRVDEDAIKAWVLDRAPAYQHPRRVWFLAALPLNSTSKVDRIRLISEAAERMRSGAMT